MMAGDFNQMPWSHRVRALADAAGGVLAGPARATYHLRGAPLPIDHVVAPGGGAVRPARPTLGADHRGIVADVTLAP